MHVLVLAVYGTHRIWFRCFISTHHQYGTTCIIWQLATLQLVDLKDRCDFATETLSHRVFKPVCRLGVPEVHRVIRLSKDMHEQVEGLLDTCPGEYVPWLIDLQVVCVTLFTIADPAPSAIENITIDRKQIRAFLGGEWKNEWDGLAELLEKTPPWDEYVRDYRRAALSDLTIGPAERNDREALEASNTLLELKRVVGDLDGWLAICRARGLGKLEQLVEEKAGEHVRTFSTCAAMATGASNT